MGSCRASPFELLSCLPHPLPRTMQLDLGRFQLETTHGVLGWRLIGRFFFEVQLLGGGGVGQSPGFVQQLSLFQGKPSKDEAPSIRLVWIFNELKTFRDFSKALVDTPLAVDDPVKALFKRLGVVLGQLVRKNQDSVENDLKIATGRIGLRAQANGFSEPVGTSLEGR
jgi:hypothetical protein